jgi:peptide chain release factor 2
MFEEVAAKISEYKSRLDGLSRSLNLDSLREQIKLLEEKRTVEGFWNDPERASKVEQNIKGLKDRLSGPEALRREIDDAMVLIELAEGEQAESMAKELAEQERMLEDKLRKLEIASLLSDPNDVKNAIINVHPGAGGTESCDWALMLFRMIMRYCERQGFETEVVDYQDGDEAGLKGATITVKGTFAYGYLRSEAGVHRLVRISPFDAAKRRHTSFAAIEVLVEVDDTVKIDVREEDIKMDVFRSSGPGGQKVNKTSSAVRLTHLPTGIVVACQIERSQHRNRDTAMNMLKSKLYDIELRKQEADLAAAREGKKDVAWGSQIRSYVLHPYQLIKDHRTDVETGNIDRVLDGELDMFVEGYLKWKLESKALV